MPGLRDGWPLARHLSPSRRGRVGTGFLRRSLASGAVSRYRSAMDPFEIFLAAPPGLEPVLRDEAAEVGLPDPRAAPGGVTLRGGWAEVWRANLRLRGASRVLARIGAFRAMHLAQLDKRARRFPWDETLLPGTLVRVEATTHASRIYHAGAARARVEGALEAAGMRLARTEDAGQGAGEGDGAVTDGSAVTVGGVGVVRGVGAAAGAVGDAGAGVSGRVGGGVAGRAGGGVIGGAGEAAITLRVRIADDLVTLSVDTSGAPLHRRGHKQAVNAAPMRETMAALFLRAAGYRGAEPVLDPMCGSGTFPIEAAEIAAGLAPGRSRGFAFERLAGFDPAAWAALRAEATPRPVGLRFHGSDRDAGAVAMSRANAARAGVAELTDFRLAAVSDAAPPDGPPGLVMVNPPYGARIGTPGQLRPLYAALGATLAARFQGWRVGLIAMDPGLAQATGLPFAPPGPPVPHGPLKVRLFQTGPLG